VARDAALRAEQLEGDSRLVCSHGEVVADRQDDEIGLVEARDQGHVPEDARVAGEVDPEAALEPEHDPARLAGVRSVRGARRVEGVRQRHLHAVDVDRAALVDRVPRVLGDTLAGEPASQLDLRDDGAGVPLRERDGVADVVAVAVREQDQVDALGLLLRLGAARVPREERVDVDALAARGVDAERGVPEPGEGAVICHAETLEDPPRRRRTTAA
jgi:hypothetical protein